MNAVTAAVIVAVTLSACPDAVAQVRQPIDLGHGIHAAIGVAVGTGGASGATTVAVPQSNTFMVVTADGNVIIDTSGPAGAAVHHQMLTAVSAATVKAIILTHGHADHTGGVARWRGPGTDIIAHRSFDEFLDYQRRLAGFFATRNAAQFGLAARPAAGVMPTPGGALVAALAATKTFDDTLALSIGGVSFELLHTPGETPDHITVWLPQFRTAFIRDNYYDSFYEGYAGWFDGNPSTMFGTTAAAFGEMVRLAGGVGAVAARAKALVAADPVQALYLTDIALASSPNDLATLEARLAALRALEQRSGNSNERGWLQAGIRDAEAKLKR